MDVILNEKNPKSQRQSGVILVKPEAKLF